MQKKINLSNQTIYYSLRKSNRARYIRVSINSRGAVTATMPRFSSVRSLERFLVKKSDWILKNIHKLKEQKPGLLETGGNKDYLANKEKARKLIISLLSYYNGYYDFRYNRVAVRNQKSRWGSCSSKKNLNFNWRIIYLDKESAAYLVVHELCHLKEMNHSQKFWSLVGKTIPDYKMIRKKMRKL